MGLISPHTPPPTLEQVLGLGGAPWGGLGAPQGGRGMDRMAPEGPQYHGPHGSSYSPALLFSCLSPVTSERVKLSTTCRCRSLGL